jgi:hypothetical protein
MIRVLLSWSVLFASVSLVQAGDRQPLHVKYVASADKARTADFKQFLEQQFTQVSVAVGSKFDLKTAGPFDVLIIDCRIPQPLPPDFTRPTLLLGSNASGVKGIDDNGIWTAQLAGSKLDWLCLCLGNKAYDTDTKHAIFRAPFPVSPKLHRETDQYTKGPVDTWVVHEQLEGAWGLVTSAENFRGAADSEIISGGVNMYGKRGASLVREAHTFYWGFAGAPSQMTEEARKLFVNAIVYIKTFDGAKQTVRRGVYPRTALKQIRSNFFTSRLNLERFFAPEVVAMYGSDEKRFRAYYEPNGDFIYVPNGRSGIKVDEEAKQIGIPNFDVRLLDKCVAMLEANERPDLARTVLERYTGESFGTPAAWRAWLTKSRDSLFFLDNYGYRFFTQPPSAPPAKWQMDDVLTALKVAEPTNLDPVSIGSTIASRTVRGGTPIAYPGDVVTLIVRMRVADPWHTYAQTSTGSAVNATTIDLKLPDGLRFVNEWKVPPAKASDTPGVSVYEGDLLFTRDVFVTGKTGSRTVEGKIKFQACTSEQCQPPKSAPVKLRVQISDR